MMQLRSSLISLSSIPNNFKNVFILIKNPAPTYELDFYFYNDSSDSTSPTGQ